MMESRSYLIGKSEINSKDTSLIEGAVMDCLYDYVMRTGEFVPVTIGVSAFDNDPRALYDIPEVRTWAKQLHTTCPTILAVVDVQTMQWLIPCIADIEIMERKGNKTSWRMNPKTEKQFVANVLQVRNVTFKKIAKSEEEYIRLCADHTQRYNAIWSPNR